MQLTLCADPAAAADQLSELLARAREIGAQAPALAALAEAVVQCATLEDQMQLQAAAAEAVQRWHVVLQNASKAAQAQPLQASLRMHLPLLVHIATLIYIHATGTLRRHLAKVIDLKAKFQLAYPFLLSNSPLSFPLSLSDFRPSIHPSMLVSLFFGGFFPLGHPFFFRKFLTSTCKELPDVAKPVFLDTVEPCLSAAAQGDAQVQY